MESNKRVLVVEDEPLISADLSHKLDRAGYRITAIAAQAEPAFLAAEATRPDVVLMDINLDGTADGISAAKRIYSELHIPVVFLTAHDDSRTLCRAQEANPFGYLTKPATSTDLTNSIEIAIQRHRTQSAVQLRELWLETQLQSVGQGLIAASHEGTILFVNAEAERLLGTPSTKMIGSSLYSAVPLRHRMTGERADDFVRLTFLQGATTSIGGEYLVEGAGRRTITGELAIAKVGQEPIGIVFTFRDTVPIQGSTGVPGLPVAETQKDCSRIQLDLNKVLTTLEPTLKMRLSPASQLEVVTTGPVLPILGNQALVESLLVGLIDSLLESSGRVSIEICATNLQLERREIDGSTTHYVRLRFSYQQDRFSFDSAQRRRPNFARTNGSLTTVHSVLQSLRATAQVLPYQGWMNWEIDFPAAVSEGTVPGQETMLGMVIIVDEDPAVRRVLCTYLTCDSYECLGARNAQEALEWTRTFPGQVDIIVIPEAASSADISALATESANSSLLVVTSTRFEGSKGGGQWPASTSFIDGHFSKDLISQKLSSILIDRARRVLA